MKRMLMVASVPSMIGQFNMNNIQILQGLGYQVDVACNFYDRSAWNEDRVQNFIKELKNEKIKTYQIDFSRNSKNILQHIKSYRQLNLLVRKRRYEFIHCHTPIAGAIARIVANKNSVKIIYTAHGFHFFKGAPLQNWILYYPIERFLAKYTDILITINKEDYNRAKNFKARKVEYVPGVGIDIGKFKDCQVDSARKRKELGIPKEAKVLLSVGELNKNKNHIAVINALAGLKRQDVYYVICGKGVEENHLKEVVKQLGLTKQVIFAGFRGDIKEIYHISDIFIFPSKREGLSVALMEAMASGIPCIASNIRGNIDLIGKRENRLFDPVNTDEILKLIKGFLAISDEKRNQIKMENLETIARGSKEKIEEIMLNIYRSGYLK